MDDRTVGSRQKAEGSGTCQGCRHWQGWAYVQRGNVVRLCGQFKELTFDGCELHEAEMVVYRKEGA